MTFNVIAYDGNSYAVTLSYSVVKCCLATLAHRLPSDNTKKHMYNLLIQLIGEKDWCDMSGNNYAARVFHVRDNYVDYVYRK